MSRGSGAARDRPPAGAASEVGRRQFREQARQGEPIGSLRRDSATKISVKSPPLRNETEPMHCSRRRNSALGDVNAYGREYSKRCAFLSRLRRRTSLFVRPGDPRRNPQRRVWIKRFFAKEACDCHQLLDKAVFLDFVVEVVCRSCTTLASARLPRAGRPLLILFLLSTEFSFWT